MAKRPRVTFARVPQGARPCDFCLMIASRGAVYKESGANAHYHDNCHCVPTPMWEGDPYPDGYDPEALYEDYQKRQAAKAGTPTKPLTKTVEVPKSPRTFKTAADVKEFANSGGVMKQSSLDAAAREQLDYYSGYGYKNTNSYLRTGNIPVQSRVDVKGVIADIDRAMASPSARLSEPITVTRASSLSAFPGGPQAAVGTVIQDQAYLSTSLSSKALGSFTDTAAIMKIDIPAGVRGVYMDGSQFVAEREFLLDRATKLAVDSAVFDERSGRWLIHATVVP